MSLLQKIMDLFAWTLIGMPGIYSNAIFYQLSRQPGFRLVTLRKHKAGEEKNRSSVRESEKVAKGQVIQEIKHPT